MLSKPIFQYISLGVFYRFIRDAQPGWRLYGKAAILESTGAFVTLLENFNLPVTKRASTELTEYVKELAKKGRDHKLTAEEASNLKGIMIDLQKTLIAESGGQMAFVVTDKRSDVNKLLSNVAALMAPGVFESLPEIAKYDFDEGGKCIAFERPTAGAFHLLRGTESVLRQFYCSIVKRDREPLLWGPILAHLKKRRKKPPAELLDHLDNIRRSFRNPTQHPEKIYDIQEAQDLFSLCIDVVNRMVKLLRQKKV